MTKKHGVTTEGKHFCLPLWRARIEAARARGTFDRNDAWASETWDGCATHEALTTYHLDNYAGGQPTDPKLAELGLRFYKVVRTRGKKFDEALAVIERIEQRLAELDEGRSNE